MGLSSSRLAPRVLVAWQLGHRAIIWTGSSSPPSVRLWMWSISKMGTDPAVGSLNGTARNQPGMQREPVAKPATLSHPVLPFRRHQMRTSPEEAAHIVTVVRALNSERPRPLDLPA